MRAKITPEMRAYLSACGRRGGMAGTGTLKARSSEQARANVNARWDKVRKVRAERAKREVTP